MRLPSPCAMVHDHIMPSRRLALRRAVNWATPIHSGIQTNSPTLSLTRVGHVLAVDWHVSDGLRIAPFLTQLPHFSCANTDDTLSGLAELYGLVGFWMKRLARRPQQHNPCTLVHANR